MSLKAVFKIPLTRGKYALVDGEDYEELMKYKWQCSKQGYATRGDYTTEEGSKTVYMHREVFDLDEGETLDHINRNKLDNRKGNLRVSSHLENMRNQGKYQMKRGASSKYKGVHKKKNRYVASITINKEQYQLGSYKTEEQAGLQYNKYAKKYFKEYAVLNDIDPSIEVPKRTGKMRRKIDELETCF